LSVKIYKCDFDSLGVIYLSAKSFALWYLVHEDRMKSATTTTTTTFLIKMLLSSLTDV